MLNLTACEKGKTCIFELVRHALILEGFRMKKLSETSHVIVSVLSDSPSGTQPIGWGAPPLMSDREGVVPSCQGLAGQVNPLPAFWGCRAMGGW